VASRFAMPRNKDEPTMTVSTVMTSCPACCTPSSPLTDVARLMVENDCGEIPVVEDMTSRKLAGVITDRDIATRIVAAGRNSVEARAMDAMTSPAVSVQSDTSLQECCDLMESHQIRRVPVVDDSGGVVGIVSLADVVRSANTSTTVAVVKEVSSGAERS
jgi:CBS domain-containing protein